MDGATVVPRPVSLVRWREAGVAGLALQNGELVAQRQDLHVLVGCALREQAIETDHACQGQVEQAWLHNR